MPQKIKYTRKGYKVLAERKRIFITGGTGLLGQYLIRTRKAGLDLLSCYIGNYDIESGEGCRYVKADIRDLAGMKSIGDEFRPDVVIHTAGIANVDYCEHHYEEAYSSNVLGTEVIIELCKNVRAVLIYISTNAVFDGETAPYDEQGAVNPLSCYGKLKVACEGLVTNSGLRAAVVRPILMYGWHHGGERSNQVTWLLDKLGRREEVTMVEDVYENPLFAESCALSIWKIIDQDCTGLFHIAGRDIVNRYELALAVADVFQLDRRLIRPVKSDYFPSLAPRPKNTSFITKKMENDLGIRPLGLTEGLRLMKNQLVSKK